MARKCAYCESVATLTRDHVWPSCFLDRKGRTAAHFSLRAGKVHGADYVVADVCADCNRERLGPLDAYFCRLYDESFVTLHDFDTTVTFRFDFDLLVRALLKIAYNSARCAGSSVAPFLPMRSYILGSGERPKALAALLEIVSPSLVPDDTVPGGKRKVMPEMYRSGVTQLLSRAGALVMTRVVAIHSFYFHLVLPLEATSYDDFTEAVNDLESSIQGVIKLTPEASEVILQTSPQDGLTSFTPHLEAYSEQYADYFEKRRQRET